MPKSKSNQVTARVARIHAKILAIVIGALFGLSLFAMTAWLVIKDGPDAGPHLQLLGQYFIGYSVTWVGSFVGLVYGALVGGLIGWTIGMIYNRIVDL
ncbi:MAG: hypothetical protein HKN37_17335 [Rhodothermales bacterium]|nr:hypothetical protein [Rhodothermales bacterium]